MAQAASISSAKLRALSCKPASSAARAAIGTGASLESNDKTCECSCMAFPAVTSHISGGDMHMHRVIFTGGGFSPHSVSKTVVISVIPAPHKDCAVARLNLGGLIPDKHYVSNLHSLRPVYVASCAKFASCQHRSSYPLRGAVSCK
eukprot:6473306-Amphidinium_carterae.1